jgi:hypothetical protein
MSCRSYCDPEVELPTPGGPRRRGHDQARGWFEKELENVRSRIIPDRFVEEDDVVAGLRRTEVRWIESGEIARESRARRCSGFATRRGGEPTQRQLNPPALPRRFHSTLPRNSGPLLSSQRFRFGSALAEMGDAWLEQATSCLYGESNCCGLLPPVARTARRATGRTYLLRSAAVCRFHGAST